MTLVARSHNRTAKAASAASADQLLIVFLVLSLVMPFFFFLGGLRLSMYRVYLLVVALPIMIRWINGASGRVRLPDFLVLVGGFWMTGALFVNHGVADQWEFAGILLIETLIPYFVARTLLRDLRSFQWFVRWYFRAVLVLLPFALLENKTGNPLLIDIFSGVLNVYRDVAQEPRLGLERAQVTMPHPILFGVFCAPAFALSWYVLGTGASRFKRARRPFVVGVAVFSSLSSGAFLSVLLQGLLIAWDEILKQIKSRWKIFLIIFGALYIALELASNRNAFQIIASELTFSAGSAWNRIHIFRNAIDDVLGNPIFGIGLWDWTRPGWMKPSVDNFWLLLAMRYGIVTWFLITLASVYICWKAATASLTGAHSMARRGYLIAFISISVSAFTVHLWDASYCMFMFLLGAGVWFSDPECTQDPGDEVIPATTKRKRVQYTRFADPVADAQP